MNIWIGYRIGSYCGCWTCLRIADLIKSRREMKEKEFQEIEIPVIYDDFDPSDN